MYQKVRVINTNEDRGLKYEPIRDLSFAEKQTIIPILYSEFKLFCCEYPIVFVGDEKPIAAIVVKLTEESENLAINKEGRWRGAYVPAFLRRYPFILAEVKKGVFSLAYDEESGCFGGEEGEAVLDENGKPTERIQKIIEFLNRYEEEMTATHRFVETLKEKRVLDESVLTYAVEGEEHRIGGFRSVVREKVNEVDDETLLEWARKSWLDLIAMQQLSMKNFQKLAAAANH